MCSIWGDQEFRGHSIRAEGAAGTKHLSGESSLEWSGVGGGPHPRSKMCWVVTLPHKTKSDLRGPKNEHILSTHPAPGTVLSVPHALTHSSAQQLYGVDKL